MAKPDTLDALKSKAESGDAESQYAYAQQLFAGNDGDGDMALAREMISRACAQDHPDALFMSGVWSQTGEIGEENALVAADFYRRASALGHGKAGLNLGILYQIGLGVPRDFGKAREYYEIAAQNKSGHAAANLGALYESGDLTDGEPDRDAAIEWYGRAIDMGYAEARTALANVRSAAGIPDLISGAERPKSRVLWKRLLGLR